MANTELNDNQIQIILIDFQSEKITLYKLITTGYEDNLDYDNVLSFNFRSFSHGGSIILYSSLWIILILHLLIV